jgi:hypothetical protein
VAIELDPPPDLFDAGRHRLADNYLCAGTILLDEVRVDGHFRGISRNRRVSRRLRLARYRGDRGISVRLRASSQNLTSDCANDSRLREGQLISDS